MRAKTGTLLATNMLLVLCRAAWQSTMDMHSTGEGEPPFFADVGSGWPLDSCVVLENSAACPSVTARLTELIATIPELTIAFDPPRRRLTEPQSSCLVPMMSVLRHCYRRQPARGMGATRARSKPTEKGRNETKRLAHRMSPASSGCGCRGLVPAPDPRLLCAFPACYMTTF